MKTDKEINEIIKQGLEEYAKADTKPETMEVKFSKEHEEKMKAMFDNMRKGNKSKKPEDRELVIHIKFNWLTKVAVAIIVVGVFVSAVSKGIKAWRECKLNSYEGESGEYSWLLPNDTSEMYKKKTDEEKIEYVKEIFPSLSGEITNVEIEEYSKTQRIRFKNNEKSISIKISESVNFGVDISKDDTNTIVLNGREVLFYLEKDVLSYFWEAEGLFFHLYSDMSKTEMSELCNDINYEKIETNF